MALAAVTWRFQLLGRTRMLSEAFTSAGTANLFVQIPSARTAAQRVGSWLRPRAGEEHVLRPWPAAPARLWLRMPPRLLEQRMRSAARALRRALERRVDWSSAVALVVTPSWTPWLRELPFGRVLYDCIDELEVQVPRRELVPLYRDWEAELLARASGALVTARELGRELIAKRPGLPIALVPNGVDARWFAERAAASPPPPELARLPRPIVGFVGALYSWIDWELIESVARALPVHSFAFVGPSDGHAIPAALRALPNVHFLGPRPYAAVPACMAAFDLAWVPFRDDAVGNKANPVKLYEYLSVGKPVISTPVADLEDFEGLVECVRGPREALERIPALTAEPARDAEQRRAFAARCSWDARAAATLRFADSLAPHPPA